MSSSFWAGFPFTEPAKLIPSFFHSCFSIAEVKCRAHLRFTVVKVIMSHILFSFLCDRQENSHLCPSFLCRYYCIYDFSFIFFVLYHTWGDYSLSASPLNAMKCYDILLWQQLVCYKKTWDWFFMTSLNWLMRLQFFYVFIFVLYSIGFAWSVWSELNTLHMSTQIHKLSKGSALSRKF